MSPLHILAATAGIARIWTDANGVARQVSDESLHAILTALDLPADSASNGHSQDKLRQRQQRRPPMMTVDCSAPLDLPLDLRDGVLTDETGASVKTDGDDLRLRGIAEPGYYRIIGDGASIELAVAPTRAPTLRKRGWGVTIQIPSLRAEGDFGDFGALAHAVTLLGRSGAQAVALSPVHALSDTEGFAPYSPSSRLFLNHLLGEAGQARPASPADLIDWKAAGTAKRDALRSAFDRLSPDREQSPNLPTEDGEGDPFAAFLQWNARRGLDAVQQAARDAGMAVGIITDLAVGVDPAGMDARNDPAAFLRGLTIGAPPDPLGPLGQDWGLTGFSPHGLIDSGFAPFIAMLRANIPPGGGIRIDHAFGLQRLWVIPAGRPASEGAYLAYPFADLLRLIKLEAWRKGAIVIAEDLGTRPPGFGEKLEAAGLYGMAVLSFCRDEQGAFVPAADYPASAVAMSGTHDVATLAGWWTGRDLEWNRAIGRGGDSEAKRAKDCRVLWQAIGGDLPQPAVHDPAPMVDRALDYLAATPCPLLLVPMEDLIGLTEQPNIPGTIDEHPNWRRRLPDTIDALLTRPEVARRIHRLNEERGA